MAPPWQDKQLSYGAKLGLMLVSALLLVILLVSLFVAIGVGIIPALIIAYYVGRKNITQAFPMASCAMCSSGAAG